ncbi:YfhH family protein [Fictibacillus sp. WQ 8-8]|uniref:YfhH family protein n=1 Tax=Fictibacillus sp. WQ 8-8 TaxID=2938788 RepID=UPI0006A7A6CE|nr:YfhH family protein [Fictibacillus sp. WQ 8-8]MCQ6267421.1 YfhH family protein [Fictibacillus sp. WQ 8-8]
MEKRYSEMTKTELTAEIADLHAKAQKAEQMGMISEFSVYERKITMAKSYLLDPSVFEAGETYPIQGDPGSTFKIVYMNGIFAWGYRNESHELEAFPIAMLVQPS